MYFHFYTNIQTKIIFFTQNKSSKWDKNVFDFVGGGFSVLAVGPEDTDDVAACIGY